MRIAREIGQYKKEHNMQVVQTGRYGDVIQSRIAQGEDVGLNGSFMREVMEAIHGESVRQQLEVVNADKEQHN